MEDLLQTSQKCTDGGVGATAFRPKSRDVVPLDSEFRQHRDQLATSHIGRCYEARADTDTTAGCERRDYRIARVHYDARRRYELDYPFADLKRPTKRLARALVAEIDRVVPVQLVGMRRVPRDAR